MQHSFESLVARNGQELVCAIVSRSRARNRDHSSLNDQVSQCKDFVVSHYSGTIRFIEIVIEGCGGQGEHQKILDLQRQVASGTIDLVIAVDLSRISRTGRAYRFCEQCADFQTRVITLDDNIDTAVSGWHCRTTIETFLSEQFRADTSTRIMRGQRNRIRQGGMLARTVYGYRKPKGARTDREIQKDPEAEPIIREMFRRLEHGSSFAEIAAWLNESNVGTGSNCKRQKWSIQAVRRFVRMPILKGLRIRRICSRQGCQHGRSRVVEESFDTRECPELAFFTEAYFDSVMDLIDSRCRGQQRLDN